MKHLLITKEGEVIEPPEPIRGYYFVDKERRMFAPIATAYDNYALDSEGCPTPTVRVYVEVNDGWSWGLDTRHVNRPKEAT